MGLLTFFKVNVLKCRVTYNLKEIKLTFFMCYSIFKGSFFKIFSTDHKLNSKPCFVAGNSDIIIFLSKPKITAFCEPLCHASSDVVSCGSSSATCLALAAFYDKHAERFRWPTPRYRAERINSSQQMFSFLWCRF